MPCGAPTQGGYLPQDPRETQAAWQEALRPVLGGLGVDSGASDVAQVRGMCKGDGCAVAHPAAVCTCRFSLGLVRTADGTCRPGARACVQLLNVAYAQHELTGGSTGAALAWLEAGGAANIDDLLAQSPGQQ